MVYGHAQALREEANSLLRDFLCYDLSLGPLFLENSVSSLSWKGVSLGLWLWPERTLRRALCSCRCCWTAASVLSLSVLFLTALLPGSFFIFTSVTCDDCGLYYFYIWLWNCFWYHPLLGIGLNRFFFIKLIYSCLILMCSYKKHGSENLTFYILDLLETFFILFCRMFS